MSKPYWTKENFPITPNIRNPAGSLAFKCGQWRSVRPVLDEKKCTKCGICVLHCPDDAIAKNEKGEIEINYDYCKGCGICENECPAKALKMIVEVAEK